MDSMILNIAVDMVGTGSVRNSDTSSGASGVKDDFKKLLQSRQDETQSAAQETSDPEASDAADVKAEEGASETGEESAETSQEEASDTEEMVSKFAAYQMSQTMRPEMLQITDGIPETVAVAAEPTIVAEVEGTPAAETAGLSVEHMNADDAAPGEMDEAAVIQQNPVDSATGSESQVQTLQIENRSESSESFSEQTEEKTETRTAQLQGQPEGTTAGREATVYTAANISKVQVPESKQEYASTVYVSQPEELPEQLGDQLLSKMANGVREFEIQIEPQNLGKILVKIHYSENQAMVSITCSEKSTMHLLAKDAGEIGNMIDRNLGGVTTIIVEEPENDYLDQARDDGQQQQQNEEQQNREEKQRDSEDVGDFLQKLRLGLVS